MNYSIKFFCLSSFNKNQIVPELTMIIKKILFEFFLNDFYQADFFYLTRMLHTTSLRTDSYSSKPIVVTNNRYYDIDPRFIIDTGRGSSYPYIKCCASCKCEKSRHTHGQCQSCECINVLRDFLKLIQFGNCVASSRP